MFYSCFALDIRCCVKQCEESGCFGERCFPNYKISSDKVHVGHLWDKLEPFYVRWKKMDCQNECQYRCMLDREKQRESLNEDPIKYHGRWPFKHIYGIKVCF